MPRYTRGDQLIPSARAAVLRAYVHRWTEENARQTYGGRCPACVQGAPPTMSLDAWHAHHVRVITDAQWLRDHAFRTRADGALDGRARAAAPAFYAETEA